MTREEAIKRLEDTFEGWNMWVMDNDSPASKMSKALGMAMYALREQPRWISVEERLPESGGSVLIYSPCGGVAEGTYSEHYKRWVQYRWSVFEPEVTHWMPLPEPPEVEV